MKILLFNKIKLIGALTAKPYSFSFRKWKLKSLESIDLLDSFGSSIRIDIEGSSIKRILPYYNNMINDEWITDKARFAYDGLKGWELVQPYIKYSYLKKFLKKSWYEIFNILTIELKKKNYSNFFFKSGNFSDLENITLLKTISNKSGQFINNTLNIPYDLKKHYLFNLNIKKIFGNKIIFLIGSNLRFENPLLNLKIKKLLLKKNILIYHIGSPFDSTYYTHYLGNSFFHLIKIISGKHKISNYIKKFLLKNNNNNKINFFIKNSISLFFGSDFLNRIDSYTTIINFIKKKNIILLMILVLYIYIQEILIL